MPACAGELSVERIYAAREIGDAGVLNRIPDIGAELDRMLAPVPRKRIDKLPHVLFARIRREAAVADAPITGRLEQRNAIDVRAVERALEAELLPKLLSGWEC